MNKTINNILQRRSIRNFKTKQIEEEKIELLLKCALNAPTAKNMQEWYFSIIQNEEIRKLLPPNCFNAPTVILIFGQKDEHWTKVDCGIACENICIAAKSLNLETCIIGSIRTKLSEELLTKLHVPNNYEFIVAISIGYGDGEPITKDFKPNKYEIIK